MKEHKKLGQKQVAKVTLHFVLGPFFEKTYSDSLTPGSQKSATLLLYIAMGQKLGTFGFSYVV